MVLETQHHSINWLETLQRFTLDTVLNSDSSSQILTLLGTLPHGETHAKAILRIEKTALTDESVKVAELLSRIKVEGHNDIVSASAARYQH
jgi:peroxiredoxin